MDCHVVPPRNDASFALVLCPCHFLAGGNLAKNYITHMSSGTKGNGVEGSCYSEFIFRQDPSIPRDDESLYSCHCEERSNPVIQNSFFFYGSLDPSGGRVLVLGYYLRETANQQLSGNDILFFNLSGE